MSSTGDRDATRAAVWVIEEQEYVDTRPPLGTSLFDDPAKLQCAMRDTARSLAAGEAALIEQEAARQDRET